MFFEYQTICWLDNFWAFQNQTSPVFRSCTLNYIEHLDIGGTQYYMTHTNVVNQEVSVLDSRVKFTPINSTRQIFLPGPTPPCTQRALASVWEFCRWDSLCDVSCRLRSLLPSCRCVMKPLRLPSVEPLPAIFVSWPLLFRHHPTEKNIRV